MKVPTVVLYSTHGTSFTCSLVTIIEYADYLFKKVKLLDKYLRDGDLLSEHFNHFALFGGTTP